MITNFIPDIADGLIKQSNKKYFAFQSIYDNFFLSAKKVLGFNAFSYKVGVWRYNVKGRRRWPESIEGVGLSPSKARLRKTKG